MMDTPIMPPAAHSAPAAVTLPNPDWRPACLKPHLWPEADQLLWEKACMLVSLTEEGGDAAALSPESRKKIQKGYGAWLSFLAAQGWLLTDETPVQRVTRARLAAYYIAMQALDRRPYSILGRFMELRMTLKAMAPQVKTGWILTPNGVSIRQMLNPAPRHKTIPDAKVLFKWGMKLMDSAKLDAPRRYGLVQFRDGLLIAMLASRGRRLRSMALLRVGQEFIRCGDGYRIELQPHQVKTKTSDCFNLPARLTPYIETYLRIVRPALLRERMHDALWIGLNGSPLEAKGIQEMVCKLSKARFGVAFGPHRFRHAIATTVPLKAPEIPGLAAPLLGITKETVQSHYDRASQVMAVKMFHEMLDRREAR